MKSNAPWSVKGIDRDARETAKEAARREGMTVGEWLNQMIFSHSEAGGEGPAQTGALADSEVEGLKLRDIVTAIEHLRNRAVEAEAKQARVMGELTRSMGGFVERVQRLERVKPAEGSYQDVAQRLEKLERAGGDRQRIDALKALEKAVAQVAVQFNNAHRATLTRLDSAEAQLQEFAERIDRVGGDGGGQPAELGSLKGAIEGLAERVARAERIASEAASLKTAAADSSDPEFVERTGARLRVLGDEIKRGGDQIRALENTIAKLSGQIEAAEKRSSEGVQKVADTIAEVRTQLKAEAATGGETPDVETMLSAARRETDERLDALQRSLEDMTARFEALRNESGTAAQARPEPTVGEAHAVAVEAAPAPSAPSASAAEPADEIDDVIDEIEEAVAALEAEDDPFAFGDDDEEEPETDDEAAADFSFQLDEETGGDDGDITVRDEDEDEDVDAAKARSLLAEVRNALSGDGAPSPSPAPVDDDIDSIIAGFDNDAPSFEQASHDGDDDEQAPNTASLASGMGRDADNSASDEDAAPKPTINKVDMVRAARERAREAAARESEDGRPRRGELTAKQRAILAARARQKRTAEAGLAAPETPVLREPAPEKLSGETPADAGDEDESHEGGRFSKFAAILSSARSRLGRKKEEKTGKNADVRIDDAPYAAAQDEKPKRNNDRAALETLQSTASARPVTLALAVAIILAIAALVFLMKDFIFKPDGADPRTPGTLTLTPAPAGAEAAPSAAAVPDAPAVDPQALYRQSIAALNAAEDEAAARVAIRTLQDAAALGFPPAQLQLGELYKTGQGVEQDLGQARIWFRRAANGGNVLAMHRIGVMTARGDGGAADPQEAIGWFERAANFGLVDSQYNLGAIYHPSADASATSVQDAGKAYYWYSLAGLNGDTAAGELAAGVGAALSPTQRSEIDAEVAAWKAQSANAEANASAG